MLVDGILSLMAFNLGTFDFLQYLKMLEGSVVVCQISSQI
jgi:hypothetical protein